MPISIDPVNRRLVLDSTSVTAREIYAAWVDWVSLADNIKYLPAFRSVGGDDLGGGLLIPPYYFLSNNWRVRPMEANQTLTVDGNLFVDGGGEPVVQTLGSFRVLTRLVVPVQAQGISTSGSGGSGSSGPSASEIAASVRFELQAEFDKLDKIARLHGVGSSLVVSPNQRSAGDLVQSITSAGDTVTVSAV